MKIELAGVGGYDAALYCGTGCFHRRESLCGKVYSEDYKGKWDRDSEKNSDRTVNELEAASKVLASCSYEKNTQWGKEVTLSLSLLLFLSLCVPLYGTSNPENLKL